MMRTFILTVCLATYTANVQASHVYEFIQEGTGDTLARWELSSLPASYGDVVELLFTYSGEAIFGLGLEYNGEFDHVAASSAFDDGMGGLADDGNNNLFGGWIFDEDDAPISILTPNATTARTSLVYHNALGQDQIIYQHFTGNDYQDIIVYGDWKLASIPEPHTLAMLSVGGVLCALWRSRRPTV